MSFNTAPSFACSLSFTLQLGAMPAVPCRAGCAAPILRVALAHDLADHDPVPCGHGPCAASGAAASGRPEWLSQVKLCRIL